MGRKGWTHLGMPSAYVQIIRGPRPKVGAVALGALPVQVCWWREGQGQPGRDQRQSTASSPFARSDPAKSRSNQFRIALPRRNREQGLVEGKDRLTALQREANATPQSPPPTVPTDFAHELARLRASVQLWKAREGRVEVRIAGAGHPVTRFGDDTTRQSVGTATQCSSLMETLINSADGSMTRSDAVNLHRIVRYGLREVRVGEASHAQQRWFREILRSERRGRDATSPSASLRLDI